LPLHRQTLPAAETKAMRQQLLNMRTIVATTLGHAEIGEDK
jgi:hypothetical protein